MLKIIIIASFSCVLVMVVMRFFPKLRLQIQRLLQNPFVKAILFRGLWRLSFADISEVSTFEAFNLAN